MQWLKEMVYCCGEKYLSYVTSFHGLFLIIIYWIYSHVFCFLCQMSLFYLCENYYIIYRLAWLFSKENKIKQKTKKKKHTHKKHPTNKDYWTDIINLFRNTAGWKVLIFIVISGSACFYIFSKYIYYNTICMIVKYLGIK